MMKIDLNTIEKDYKDFDISLSLELNYIYFQLLDYFQSKAAYDLNSLSIGIMALYSWMPQQLKYFNDKSTFKIIPLINEIRVGESTYEDDLKLLKDAIGHSMPCVSKLLHFVNPNFFPIWDTHICNYLENRFDFSATRSSEIDYIKYTSECRRLIKETRFIEIHEEMNSTDVRGNFPIRNLELIMYCKAKKGL